MGDQILSRNPGSPTYHPLFCLRPALPAFSLQGICSWYHPMGIQICTGIQYLYPLTSQARTWGVFTPQAPLPGMHAYGLSICLVSSHALSPLKSYWLRNKKYQRACLLKVKTVLARGHRPLPGYHPCSPCGSVEGGCFW